MNKQYWSAQIQNLVPYTAGEQPKDRSFIKLNANENPYPPSPKVLEAIRLAADDRLRLYPDMQMTKLRAAMAEYYHLQPEQVFCGNGSDEVLAFCFYAFFTPGRKILFPDITYSFYPVYTNLYHLDYEEVPLNEDFSFPVEKFLRSNGGVIVCNPNAPTGKALPLAEIRRILEANPNVVVMVDEAEYPNLIVVHTMSKSRSMAGVRVGCALGHPDLIAALNCVKNSFNSYPLDHMALAAGEAAIRDVEYFHETCQKIIATREDTAAKLRQLGFFVHDSNANFILATHPDRSAKDLLLALRERGLLVRWFDKPRIRDYLRITIGTDAEMDALCAACQDILKG